jgi:hypothetical protein
MSGEGSVCRRASVGRWVGAVTLGYDERGNRIKEDGDRHDEAVRYSSVSAQSSVRYLTAYRLLTTA